MHWCIYLLFVASWHYMVTCIYVNIGSGNGLMPDGNKPLPEPMLTHDHTYSVPPKRDLFPRKCSSMSNSQWTHIMDHIIERWIIVTYLAFIILTEFTNLTCRYMCWDVLGNIWKCRHLPFSKVLCTMRAHSFVLYVVGAFRGGIGADMEYTDMVQF